MAAALSSHNRTVQAERKDMLKEGKYSDLVIRAGGHDFKVHKTIVCPASEFAAMAMKHPNTIEAQENIIDLVEFDAETIGRVLHYIYEGDYDASMSDTNQELIAHAKIYSAADFLLVPKLKETAFSRFKNLATSPSFRAMGFIEVLAQIYTDRSIHDINGLGAFALSFSLQHLNELIILESFKLRLAEEMEDSKDLREFAVELLTRRVHSATASSGERLEHRGQATKGSTTEINALKRKVRNYESALGHFFDRLPQIRTSQKLRNALRPLERQWESSGLKR